MWKYLQFVTELLGIGDEAAVRVSFVEPGTAAHLSLLLFPVHSSARTLIKLHIIASTICTYDHILRVGLDWEIKVSKNMFTLLILNHYTDYIYFYNTD